MASSFTITAAAIAADPKLDIIFIHGLGGSASESWAYDGAHGERAYWPTLLGETLPSANVSVVGYPTAKLGKMLGGNEMGILTAAAGVVDLLVSHDLGQRPIFFVAHSLGGIVTKAFLRQCGDSADPRKRALLDATQGIVLFGTPNSGASMGNVCAHVPGLASMQAAELSRADSLLLELGQWFRGKAGIEKIRCHCFFETERLHGQIIVDAASANPGVEGCDPTPLTENHVRMCKIPSREHSTFTSVSAFIATTCLDRGIDIGRYFDEGDALKVVPKLLPEYLSALFLAPELRHLHVPRVDEREIFVDPVIYHENNKSRITSLDAFLTALLESEAAIISGNDRSGKSVLTKMVQAFLDERGKPTVRLNGRNILNADIVTLVGRLAKTQYGTNAPLPEETTIIIDDFDECQLQDSIKERIVFELTKNFDSIILTAFTHAPSVLFTPSDRPDPDLFEISPIGDERLLELVERWRNLGRKSEFGRDEKGDLATFELLRKLYSQTEVDKFPGSALSFLQLIDSSSGNDITFSSYAACYETMISAHITKIRPNSQSLDEARNFIAYVAFQAYLANHSPLLSSSILESCLTYYNETYCASAKYLREVLTMGFLVEVEGGYKFREEYEWYFLCARHAAKSLKSGPDYDTFVMECTTNIFSKQYANMVIFMAYFSDDNIILELLLDILDGLFARAPTWKLSDEQKTIMLGLTTTDQLAIQSSSDNSPSRIRILRERVVSILDDAEDVVAQYALPFINPDIGDSEYIQSIDPTDIDAESYMNSLNALMRVHSVIGQILASRSGTFDAKTLINCVTRMVQASGRYIALNHAISAVLIADKGKALEEVQRAYDSQSLNAEEKWEKVERIFSFWSVFLSQAGLARYLSHDHAIRALKMLVGKYENAEQYKPGHIPFNFTSVLVIAYLYKNGTLNRELFEDVLERYGSNSAIIPVLRVAVHFYSYYMPLSIKDKQWLGAKLNMPVRRIEVQRRQAVFSGRVLPPPPVSDKPKRRKPRRQGRRSN